MNHIDNLFFELLRVSIGTQDKLTRPPSADEWKQLYDMAKKQSVIGICYAGVQKLTTNHPSQVINLSEYIYLQWMGMAAVIQQRNEVFRKKGEGIISALYKEGMDACVLKGQTLAPHYGKLCNLRQSGDIDVWVKNRSVMELDAYVKWLGLIPHTTAAHVSYEDKDGVEVELHAVPAFMRNFCTNRKLVQWFKEFNGSTIEFNLVYMMVHMYHHVLFEGLGLRQLMDYYFVLRTVSSFRFQDPSGDNLTKTIKTPEGSVLSILDNFGMKWFASGIMWIMKEVFAMEDKYLICEASEKYGRMILVDVMTGGNFGHHDEKNKGLHSDSAVSRSFSGLKRNMKFFVLGPCEILSSPVWSLWHLFWRKRRGYM